MFKKNLSVALMTIIVLLLGIASGSEKAEEAFVKLMDGNKRFVSGSLSQKDLGDARRKDLLKGQSPFAIVVACSDSRVPPEIIFDQGLGELFVVRVAGNVLDPIALGSIEYAAEHLHSPLLIILGHDKCGAVAATLHAKGAPEGNIGAIVRKILPAVKRAKAKGGIDEEVFSNAIKLNVMHSYRHMLAKSPVLRHMIKSGELKAVAGIYHLDSGGVEILDIPSPAPAKPEATEHKK